MSTNLGGGVMVYVKNVFQCIEIKWSYCNDLEYIGLNITLSPHMTFTVIVIYRHPASDCSFYQKLETLLKECNFNKEIIIMGDVNINWEDNSSRKNLKRITDKCDLSQMINGPTRITISTKSQIDLIFTNRPERIFKSLNITGVSDHNLTLVARKLTKKRFQPNLTENEFIGIPRCKQESFNNTVQQVEWDNVIRGTDSEEDTQKFTKTLEKTSKKFSSKIKFKPNKNQFPWMNSNIIK